MNRQRFVQLAEAYGGRISRWPSHQGEAARRLAEEDPAFAAEALGRAAALDGLLDADPAPTPSAALVGRVLAARVAPPRAGWRSWLGQAGLGMGLAAACAAGLVLGVELAPATSDGESLIATVAGASSLDLGEDA